MSGDDPGSEALRQLIANLGTSLVPKITLPPGLFDSIDKLTASIIPDLGAQIAAASGVKAAVDKFAERNAQLMVPSIAAIMKVQGWENIHAILASSGVDSARFADTVRKIGETLPDLEAALAEEVEGDSEVELTEDDSIRREDVALYLAIVLFPLFYYIRIVQPELADALADSWTVYEIARAVLKLL
jgi:hypothetical protein